MNKNILTFDEWAVLGKDQGMEKGHHASVQHMLNNIFAYYEKKTSNEDFWDNKLIAYDILKKIKKLNDKVDFINLIDEQMIK